VETPDPGDDVVYHVDPEGRITFVNDRWDAFARANGGTAVLGAAVIGRRAVNFIAGNETRHLFELIIRHAIKSGRPVTLPYRCDGPAVRRRMQLTVTAEAPAQVVFRSRMLAEEPRRPIAWLESRTGRERAPLLRLCSWCNRGEIGGRWAEIEEVIAAYGLFDAEAVPEITHGLCVDCERTVLCEWLDGESAAP
jgi:hypothetical protein